MKTKEQLAEECANRYFVRPHKDGEQYPSMFLELAESFRFGYDAGFEAAEEKRKSLCEACVEECDRIDEAGNIHESSYSDLNSKLLTAQRLVEKYRASLGVIADFGHHHCLEYSSCSCGEEFAREALKGGENG